ncbi:hypothetical protein ACLOJK_024313 [Asimina triloba]
MTRTYSAQTDTVQSISKIQERKQPQIKLVDVVLLPLPLLGPFPTKPMFAAATLGSAVGFSFGKSSSRIIADGTASDPLPPPPSLNPSAFSFSPVSALKRPAYAVRLAVACSSSSDVITERHDQNGQLDSEGSQSVNYAVRRKRDK